MHGPPRLFNNARLRTADKTPRVLNSGERKGAKDLKNQRQTHRLSYSRTTTPHSTMPRAIVWLVERTSLTQFQNNGCVVRRPFQRPGSFVYLTCAQPVAEFGRKKKMINPNSTIVFKGLPEVIPERKQPALSRMQQAKCVRITEFDHGPIAGPRLRLKQGVMNPRGWLVTVNIFRDNVEVPSNSSRDRIVCPSPHLPQQTVHPRKFVDKPLASHRIAIRQVDVHDPKIVDHRFEKTSVTVFLIAGKRRVHRFDWKARQNRNAVIGLLCNGNALVP